MIRKLSPIVIFFPEKILKKENLENNEYNKKLYQYYDPNPPAPP
jgi:hypothetical protein